MKKLSVVFVSMLLGQTLVSPALTLSQETVPEVVAIEKEEDLSNERPLETPIEDFVKESEALPEEQEVLEEKVRSEEIPKIPVVQEETVEKLSTPLTDQKPAEEKAESFESATIIATGKQGTAPWSLDSEGRLTFKKGNLVSSTNMSNTIARGLGSVNKSKVKEIVFTEEIVANKKQSFFFEDLANLEAIHGLENWDVSNTTDMSYMFFKIPLVTSLDLSNFDTSQVTQMRSMFEQTSSLTSLDLSNFNTSQVTNMNYMFSGASSLTSLDLSNFNTSQVTQMTFMFSGASSLTSLDLSNFNTSQVTDIGAMFRGVSSLTSLDLSNFNTSQVTNMGSMFSGASSLTSLDLSNFNTSKVTVMSYMFNEASSLTSLNISSWDTSALPINTSKTIYVFKGALNLQKITLGKKTKFLDEFTGLPDSSWVSIDGPYIAYDDSWSFLSNGTEENSQTFMWMKKVDLPQNPMDKVQPNYQLTIEKEVFTVSMEELESLSNEDILERIGAVVEDLHKIMANPEPVVLNRKTTEGGLTVEIGIKNPYKTRAMDEAKDKTDYDKVYQEVKINLLSNTPAPATPTPTPDSSQSSTATTSKAKETPKTSSPVSPKKEAPKTKETNLPETGEKRQRLALLLGVLLLATTGMVCLVKIR